MTTPLTAASEALLDWLDTERTITSPYGPPVSIRFDRLALSDRLAAIEAAAAADARVECAALRRQYGVSMGAALQREADARAENERLREALTIIAEAPEKSDAPITVKARNIARVALAGTGR